MFTDPQRNAEVGKRIKQRASAGVLGKHLTRRSGGRCELCESRDQVKVYELPPFPIEPDPERTVMACGRCRTWLITKRVDLVEARFLATAVWSELEPVRLAAGRLLLSASGADLRWLEEALEVVDVDPSTGEFRDAPVE
jgi:protein PhnA